MTMDDARRIENLIYRYAELIDDGDLDGVAALFTHGRIHGQDGGPPGTVFEGRDGARRMYEMATRLHDDGTPRTKHVTTNVRIEVDEGTATAHSYYCATQATAVLPLQVIVTGRYRDTFHRVDDAWWFDTRTLFVDQVGELGQHLKF